MEFFYMFYDFRSAVERAKEIIKYRKEEQFILFKQFPPPAIFWVLGDGQSPPKKEGEIVGKIYIGEYGIPALDTNPITRSLGSGRFD